jgi:hypothetical protein
MPPAEAIKAPVLNRVLLCGREVEYRLVSSGKAKHLRIRATLNGLEVVLPRDRGFDEVEPFLLANERWVIEQLARIRRYGHIRKQQSKLAGQILFRGHTTPIRVEYARRNRGANKVSLELDGFVLVQTSGSKTNPARSLENWLRRRAKEEILKHVVEVSMRIKHRPKRVLVMGQRTKWGNCSALRNLSFNWRLIMAPDYVMRYLVTHEVTHLAIPDHSQRFWLTVQSLCPGAERAKQWLAVNGHRLMVDPRDMVV